MLNWLIIKLYSMREIGMGVLKVLLQQLGEVGRAELKAGADESESGAYDAVTFWETKDLATTQLAVSHPIPEENEDKIEVKKEISKTINAQNLLIDQGVDTRFLQTFLAFDETGTKYSLQATEGSLERYIEQNRQKITREQIKDIIGQMLLGIYALHEKNLVHRDVTLGNALVFINAQNLLTVLVSDLNTVIGESNLSAEDKEYVEALNENKPEGFAWRLLKADDCINLGEILKELIKESVPNQISLKEPEVRALLNLLNRGAGRDNFNRNTVEIALESDFFGVTQDSRATFFQELRDRAASYEFAGEYRARAFEPGNPFLLVKDNLKPIYFLTRKLDSQFDFFDSNDELEMTMEDKKQSSGMVTVALESLGKTFKLFNEEITTCIASDTFIAQREILLQLKIEAIVNLASIYLKYGAPTNTYIELARAQFTAINTIDSKILQAIVNSSAKEYADKCKDTPRISKLFSNNWGTGAFSADTLENEINEAVKTKNSNNEVLKLISNFLETQKGEKGEELFKTILANNIRQIADCPAGVLYDRMKEAKSISIVVRAD